MESKTCPKCERNLPIGEFFKNRAKGDGLSNYCVTCQRTAGNASNAKKRAEMVAALGGVCQRCGFADSRALQVDHVNGGGNRELRASNSRTTLANVLARSGEFQLLCANCNWIKRVEQGEHTQRRDRIAPDSVPEGFKRRGPNRKK